MVTSKDYMAVSGGNPLEGIYERDGRFVPAKEPDKDAAMATYLAWRWDIGIGFWDNLGTY